MAASLRLLLVEDSPEDADLLLLHLKAHGIVFSWVQVDTMEGFLTALQAEPWDLVLSDFSLPGTDGMEILQALRKLDPDLPFILLSGVLDEVAAVEAMRSGANDFLIKGNLSRLVPAIEREMKESGLRRKQRQFEAELRLLHTAIGQTPDMVLITDPQGVIRYANAAAEVISGYPKDELIGQNPRLFKSGSHDAAFYRSMWEALLRGETWKGHLINRRKDGGLWDAQAVIAPVFSAQGELQNYLCTARDITLERQLQGFLEQSQRLETIGTLTSGIFHDFNNILMPVMGHAELGLARPAGDPRLKHDLEVIQASANRARDLVRQILTFSRKDEGAGARVDVQNLLEESLRLLRATIPTSVAFAVDLGARGRYAQVDPTQLHQVILNLCVNAGHAMRGMAGRLTVRLRLLHLPVTPCAMNIELPAGDYLCLEVEDTGRGIAPDHLDKIFLPFFTTKSAMEGTGLGLSVTHGIISGAKGGIQVRSEVGAGTHFTVFLPLAPTGIAVPAPEPSDAVRGHGHILLVDDEAALLEMLEASLCEMGFQVSAFSDPEAALQAFLAQPQAFQSVVTDQTMPILSGFQLAEAILAIRPELPIILVTGTPNLEDSPGFMQKACFRACLTKPISPVEIAKALLQALEAGPDAPEAPAHSAQKQPPGSTDHQPLRGNS